MTEKTATSENTPWPSCAMLFGREAECAAVDRLVSTVRSGQSAMLVITGEPGIGKSSLLTYCIPRAGDDVRVLSARGARAEEDIPFAALGALLRDVELGAVDLPRQQRIALTTSLAIADAPTAGVDRFAIGAALLTVLAAVAEDQPVLVVLDDVQWMDDPSLTSMVFAARRLDKDRVGFLVGGRDASAFNLPEFPQLRLGGLNEAATANLLAEHGMTLAPAQVAQLVALTGGNPLALVDLPTLIDDERLVELGSDTEPVPIGTLLEDAYGEQIDRLPAEAHQPLLVAALMDGADLATLSAALMADGTELSALAAAENARLITIAPASVVFRHPLVRSATVQRATAGERRAAHRAIAVALADDRTGIGRTRRAWHLAAAAYGPDDEVAAALHESADLAVRVSGYASAASAYERAALLSVSGQLRGVRLFAAASAAFNAGQTCRSVDLLRSARDAATGDEETHAEVEALHGRVETRDGDPTAAYDRLVAEAHRLRQNRPDLAVQLLAAAFGAAVFAGHGSDALAVSRQAVDLSAQMPGPYGPYSRCALEIVRTMLGDASDVRVLNDALPSFLPEAELPAQALPLIGDIAFGYTILDQFERATALHGLLLRVARERAAVGLMVWPIGEQALIDFRTGHWREAYAGVLEAEKLAIDAGLKNEVANNRQLRAWIAAGRGHSDESRRYAQLTLEQARTSGAAVMALLAYCVLGLLNLGLGEPKAALAPLENARQLAEITGFRDASHFQWCAELVEAYVQAGQSPDAIALAEALADQAERTRRPIVTALAMRARGLVSSNDTFVKHFTDAIELHRIAGRPFETARTQLCFGQRLRRHRSRAEARVQLQAAWQTFNKLGADCWTERARAELMATGAPVAGRLATSMDLLTPQELQVALAVRAGASNREAAERLFLSAKTVEYHLSHIYRKLGIGSRSQLSDALSAAA
jgi:DNA-binding NarL/FixJ family response regulator